MENTDNIIENSKVLVTGGAGFIGSNLVDRLLEQGNEVVCLDNFSTGKIENLENAKKNSNFKLIEGDIRDYAICREAVKGCRFVLHQAALGSVPRSVNDPTTTTDVNIGGFVNMLTAAKDEGIKRFVYASSSSVYGDNTDLPKVEHKTGTQLSPYAVTKYVNELYAQNFSWLFGIETIGLRYFNVFGQRQDPNGAYAAVIPLWIKLLIKHESPFINGDGTYSRDFTFIENVIRANQLAATMPTEEIKIKLKDYNIQLGLEKNEVTIAEAFNVACGKRVSLNELASLLKQNIAIYDLPASQTEFKYRETRIGDVPHSLASIEKAKLLLEYSPIAELSAGLKKAFNWYWNNLR